MTTDPVCRMQVDDKAAAGSSVFEGGIYYFCSAGCKKKFDANPSAYGGTSPAGGGERAGYSHSRARAASEAHFAVDARPDNAAAPPPGTT